MAREEVFFERKIYAKMKEWKEKWSDSYALLIEGARRVGKSTSVREFSKREFRTSLIIDFYSPKDGTLEIFGKYSTDYTKLFTELQALYNIDLFEGESVVVFDEVQKYPKAREMIKGLVEYGRYSYIETGSLISIKKNAEKILIPSEEMRFEMHPMDFEEYCWAMGERKKVEFAKDKFEKKEPMGQSMHNALMELYKTYMLVGGMPQAISKYLGSHRYSDVETVKRQIISLYHEDLGKVPIKYGTVAKSIFDNIPSILSGHGKTFRPGTIRKGSRTSDYLDSMLWLEDSKICNMCYQNHDSNIAVGLDSDTIVLKPYLLDTGLLLTMSFERGIVTGEEVQRAFIADHLSINEGMFFENSVAQELKSKDHDLYFVKFYSGSDKKNPKEVDFIIPDGKKIVPIEVKSSASSRHRSLDLFSEKYKSRVKTRYVIHGKDLRIDGDTFYIPIYMTMFI